MARSRPTVLFWKIEMNVLAALSLYQLKRRTEAMASLYEAYLLAEPNKIIASFTKYGKDMRTLTASALKNEACPIPRPWLENINRKASAYAKRQSFMISEYKTANNIVDDYALTDRELEILRDLSQGLSRTEIAASQNISTNTVKMSVNIIYEKLSANNYAEVIRKAASLNII
jgi:LuxR family maltose regulon positive regulatory protein